jgi:GT2 family glycosyltransferase
VPPVISVVIPTYNRRQGLRRCLDSLAAQRHPPPFEALVVNDGSTDGTSRLLAEYDPPYPLRTFSGARGGPAAARNRGAAAAQGDYLLFLDDDTVADPDLLAAHLAAHRQEPGAVIIGPMKAPPGESQRSWVRWEQEELDKQYEAMTEGRWRPTPRQFFTANASLARGPFHEAGGFDPAFKRAEDVELGYRLRKLGLRFLFRPEAVVIHRPVRGLRSWWRIPHQYGVYDVRMWRDKGVENMLTVLGREFQERHPLVRRAIPLAVGGGLRARALAVPAVALAAICGGLGLAAPAHRLYSLAYNVLYYQGVRDELGSLPAFRSLITPAPPTSEPAGR